MKPIMWVGITFMIASFIFWIIGSILAIFESFALMIIAPIIFAIGFFILLGVVIKERLEEMKEEKGKYKQYEEED